MKKINAANDYTAGERLGIGFQNLLFGLGSYRTGHWGDGLFLTGSKLMAILLLYTATADTSDDSLNLAMGWMCASIAYGFVRPFLYYKNNSVNLSMNIGAIPTAHGVEPGVSYRLSW